MNSPLGRVRTRFNTEFDSRILRVSVGAGGVVRPKISQNGAMVDLSCLHCGRSAGAVSASIPAPLQGDPGVIYVCLSCESRLGPLPAHAISFERRQ